MRPVSTLGAALDLTDEPRVITRGQPPFAILHTNKAWSDLTGYRFAEVAYRTTAFLQGPDTEQDVAAQLSEACKKGQHAKVRLLNYTKSGEPFVNTVEVHPLRNGDGVLTHWCGVLHGEQAPKHHKALRREPANRAARSSVASSTNSAGSSSSSTHSAGPTPTGAEWAAPMQNARLAAEQQQQLLLMQRKEQLLALRAQQALGGPTISQGVLNAPLPSAMPRVAGEGPPPPSSSSSSSPPSPYRPKRQRGEKVRVADALNNTSDAVIFTQPYPPYKITHVNAPWVEMCGYTQEEVEGRTNALLHGPETDQGILRDLMSSVGRGEAASASIYNYKKNGDKFLNQVQVKPVYNDDDELEQFMALLHEVDV